MPIIMGSNGHIRVFWHTTWLKQMSGLFYVLCFNVTISGNQTWILRITFFSIGKSSTVDWYSLSKFDCQRVNSLATGYTFPSLRWIYIDGTSIANWSPAKFLPHCNFESLPTFAWRGADRIFRRLCNNRTAIHQFESVKLKTLVIGLHRIAQVYLRAKWADPTNRCTFWILAFLKSDVLCRWWDVFFFFFFFFGRSLGEKKGDRISTVILSPFCSPPLPDSPQIQLSLQRPSLPFGTGEGDIRPRRTKKVCWLNKWWYFEANMDS